MLEEGCDTVEVIIINTNNEDFHVKEREVLGTLEQVQIIDESEAQWYFLETLEVNNLNCVEKEEVPREVPEKNICCHGGQ